MSFVGKIDHLAKCGFRMANNIACCCASIGRRILLTSLVELVTGLVRGPFSYSQNEVVDLKPLWSKKTKKKGETRNRMVSYFVNRFVFLLFFLQRRRPNKQSVQLGSFIPPPVKFTLVVCISKCLCMRVCERTHTQLCVRARVCVRTYLCVRARVWRAHMCVRSFMYLATVDVCVRQCLCIRIQTAWMWASLPVWVYTCFCFLHVYRRLVGVLLCVASLSCF